MPEEFKMTVNEYMPLRDVVFHTLRQAILKGEMEPGERLMEIQLAKKLGVRLTPSFFARPYASWSSRVWSP